MIKVIADIRQTKAAAMEAAETAYNSGEGVQDALGRLILANTRKRSAKPKNATQWLCKALASTKYSNGRNIEYIHIIGENAYCTDGHRGHWAHVGASRSTGCYSWSLKGGIKRIDGIEPMAAMPRVYKEAGRDDDYQLADLRALPTQVNWIAKIVCVQIGGTWFQEKYILDAISLPGKMELAAVKDGILHGRITEAGHDAPCYFTIAGLRD